MPLNKEVKQQAIKRFARTENDTGSSEVQVAILTERITHLTAHLKVNQQDKHTRFGLTKMVSKRKKLLKYLKKEDAERYAKVVSELKLRK